MDDEQDIADEWQQMSLATWRALSLRQLESGYAALLRAEREEQGIAGFGPDDYREEIERRRSARQTTLLVVLTVVIAFLTLVIVFLTLMLVASELGWLRAISGH
jgi:hypothetical protein